MVVAQLLVPLLLLNSSLEVLSHGLEDVAGHGDVLAGYKGTVSLTPKFDMFNEQLTIQNCRPDGFTIHQAAVHLFELQGVVVFISRSNCLLRVIAVAMSGEDSRGDWQPLDIRSAASAHCRFHNHPRVKGQLDPPLL